MKTVYKYNFPLNGEFTIAIPERAEVLEIRMQHEKPAMWVMLDTNDAPVDRKFFMFGTGHPVDVDVAAADYIGQLFIDEGNLIFHVFEKPRGLF